MPPSPESSPEIKSGTLSEQLINLESARFDDRLATEHEDAWDELLELGLATGMRQEDIMTQVWKNQSVPTVFRDRAMLLVVGTPNVRNALRQRSYPTNGAFGFGYVTVATFSTVVDDFDPMLFCEWTREAWQYQQETGRPLIADERYLRFHYEFLERGLIDENELNTFIANIDIMTSSPEKEGTGWDGDSWPLDNERFPLLSDVLHQRTVASDSPRVIDWALRHLEAWLDYQKNEGIELPEWLKDTPPEAGKSLFQELIKGGDKPDWLGWKLVRKATDCFGLELFNRGSSEFNLATVHTVEDLCLKESLLRSILQAQEEKAKSGDGYYPFTSTVHSRTLKGEAIKSIDIMQEVIQATSDAELKELFAQELKRAAEYKERTQQESKIQARERAARQRTSPEYIKQQQAKAAFISRVARLVDLYG